MKTKSEIANLYCHSVREKSAKIIAFSEPRTTTQHSESNRCWKFKFIFLLYRIQIKHPDLCDPDENATRKNVKYAHSRPHLCYYGQGRSFPIR